MKGHMMEISGSVNQVGLIPKLVVVGSLAVGNLLGPLVSGASADESIILHNPESARGNESTTMIGGVDQNGLLVSGLASAVMGGVFLALGRRRKP